jgi:integrase/recombinase XerD
MEETKITNQNANPDRLDELFNQFMEEKKYVTLLRSATLIGYRASYDLFRKLSCVTINSLATESLTNFFKEMQTRTRIVGKGIEKIGVKDSTVATYAMKLNVFFEWLVLGKHITENPIRNLPIYKPVYDDKRALPKKDIERIRTAIENHSTTLLQKKRDRAIVIILTFCGIRKGELLGLQVTDVNLEKRTLLVRGPTSKSGFDRILPLTNNIITMALQDYLDQRRDYKTSKLVVSLNQDKGLGLEGLKKWVDRLEILSGVKFHLHRFRHTFATNLANQGVSPLKISRLLGHKDTRMIHVYIRSLQSEDLGPEMNLLSFDNLM